MIHLRFNYGSDPKFVERIKKSDFCYYKKAEIWIIH